MLLHFMLLNCTLQTIGQHAGAAYGIDIRLGTTYLHTRQGVGRGCKLILSKITIQGKG